MSLTIDKRLLTLPLAALLIFGWFYLRPGKRGYVVPSMNPEVAQESSVKNACVIFDLHGVLFTINKQQALSQLGLLDTIAYTLSGKKTSDLEDKIFELLDRMRPEFKSYYCVQHQDAPGGLVPLINGKPLPMVMRDWAQGTLKGTEIITKAVSFMDTLPDDFFSNANEKKLVRKTLNLIFDPKIRMKLCQTIPSGIKLLKKCKKLGHTVLLLSNMDTEFVELLKEKHPEIFELFDGTIVSASAGLIKPYSAIYDHLIKTHQVNPKLCYMIDDQEENVIGAKKAGMVGIHCDHTNHFVDVRATLRKYGVLPPKEKIH